MMPPEPTEPPPQTGAYTRFEAEPRFPQVETTPACPSREHSSCLNVIDRLIPQRGTLLAFLHSDSGLARTRSSADKLHRPSQRPTSPRRCASRTRQTLVPLHQLVRVLRNEHELAPNSVTLLGHSEGRGLTFYGGKVRV